MNDDEKVMLVECDQRSKSAIYQISEIKDDIKQVKEDQKAIYDLTTSVKIIAENVSNMKDDLEEVKKGQSDLSTKLDNQIQDVNDKVNELKFEPLEEMKKDKHELKMEILKQTVGYVITGLVGVIGALIGTGTIKL